MITPCHMQLNRIALLGAVALSVTGCAGIWGFQDFEPAPDASAEDEPASGDDGFDATIEAATTPVAMPEAATSDETDASDAGETSESGCVDGMTLCDGGCTDTTRDPYNCGGCMACPESAMCVAGACVCADNFHMCGGMCSRNSSPNSCGPTSCTPCVAPSGGTNSCTDAGCGLCFGSNTLCNRDTDAAACVDTTSDSANCGTCGKVCHVANDGGTSVCNVGTCVVTCNTGLTACPTAAPTSCVNVETDIHNCGICGKSCPAHDGGTAATCVDGGCH